MFLSGSGDVIQRTAASVLAGIGTVVLAGTAFAAPVPTFLEVGKVYRISTVLSGMQTMKILERDRNSGWVKGQSDKPKPEVYWLNTSEALTVREGGVDDASASGKPLPPISFK